MIRKPPPQPRPPHLPCHAYGQVTAALLAHPSQRQTKGFRMLKVSPLAGHGLLFASCCVRRMSTPTGRLILQNILSRQRTLLQKFGAESLGLKACAVEHVSRRAKGTHVTVKFQHWDALTRNTDKECRHKICACEQLVTSRIKFRYSLKKLVYVACT